MSADYITTLPLTKWVLDDYENLHSKEFPCGSKYSYKDELLHTHGYLNEHVHLYVQARGELYDSGIYLTDHGPRHIEMVMRRASLLVRTEKSLRSDGTIEKHYTSCLNAYETFLLALATHFHDVGNMYGREGHEQRISEEMHKIKALTIPWHQKALISQIAACHGGKLNGSRDTIKQLPSGIEHDGDISYRPQMLAAILRLADELADEHSRADNYGLLHPDKLPPTCLLFHKYAQGLRVSLDPLAGFISLNFSLHAADLAQPYQKKQKDGTIVSQYLLDEIYERTLKTYVEMQYCARYMRGLASHLHEVRVEILIYAKPEQSFPSGQLHYIIGDTDYPEFSGAESEALKRLARDFVKLPSGSQLANTLSTNQPLPKL